MLVLNFYILSGEGHQCLIHYFFLFLINYFSLWDGIRSLIVEFGREAGWERCHLTFPLLLGTQILVGRMYSILFLHAVRLTGVGSFV
jgi:hypothetical protein